MPAEASRRLIVVGVLVLALGLVGAAHGAFDVFGAGGGQHEEGHGVLSATSASGGVSVTAPSGRPEWWATFGSLVLCVTKPGAVVHVLGAHAEGKQAPLRIEHRLRTVDDLPDHPSKGLVVTPFYSAVGLPPNLSVGRIIGTVGPDVGTIRQRCTDKEGTPFRELLTEMKVGPMGGHVTRTYIDYTYRKKTYTLVVRWQMIACGSRTTKYCSSPAGTE